MATLTLLSAKLSIMLYINKFKLFNKYEVMESKQYIVLYVRKDLFVHLIQIHQECHINLLVY
jgi:hypothetical protein